MPIVGKASRGPGMGGLLQPAELVSSRAVCTAQHIRRTPRTYTTIVKMDDLFIPCTICYDKRTENETCTMPPDYPLQRRLALYTKHDFMIRLTSSARVLGCSTNVRLPLFAPHACREDTLACGMLTLACDMLRGARGMAHAQSCPEGSSDNRYWYRLNHQRHVLIQAAVTRRDVCMFLESTPSPAPMEGSSPILVVTVRRHCSGGQHTRESGTISSPEAAGLCRASSSRILRTSY